MQGNNDDDMFSVNSVTGEITLTGSLDYEGPQQQYMLSIIASVCTV